MDGVKILHTADIHLGALRTGVKGGKAEIENTFLKIIRLCKTEDIDFLLIAGDLFSTPFVSFEDAMRVISMFEQIPDTIVAISPGNHDCMGFGSVYLKYEFPKNVVIFKSDLEYIDFPKKNVRLWGAGFKDRFQETPLLSKAKAEKSDRIELLVLHGDIVSETSKSVYNPVTIKSIEDSGFDYMALGHIHKRTDIQKKGSTFFAYSGCPDALGFDETGSKGVYLGTVSKSGCNLEYIETSSRKYIEETVDVSECKNSFEAENLITEILKNTCGDAYKENLYRITIIGDVSVNSSILPNQLRSLLSEKLAFAEIIDKTEADISDLSLYASEYSLRGIFVKKMLEKIDTAPSAKKAAYKNALKIGLRSFTKGVSLHDN